MFRTQKCEFLFGIDIGDSCSDDAETCDLVVPYNVFSTYNHLSVSGYNCP